MFDIDYYRALLLLQVFCLETIRTRDQRSNPKTAVPIQQFSKFFQPFLFHKIYKLDAMHSRSRCLQSALNLHFYLPVRNNAVIIGC